MKQSELDRLLKLILNCKKDNNAPIVFVTQDLFPQDCIIGTVDNSDIPINDWYEFQINEREQRAISASLSIEPLLLS